MTEHFHAAKAIIDLVSISIAFATIVNWLPTIAAGLSILWSLTRFAEWGYGHIIKWRKSPPR